MSYQVWVPPKAGSRNRRIRTSLDLTSLAPRVSHRRVSRAVRALSAGPHWGPQGVAELGGQRKTARGGEGLTDVGYRELAERAVIDPFGRAAQSEAEHHVGKVDCLAPRRRP